MNEQQNVKNFDSITSGNTPLNNQVVNQNIKPKKELDNLLEQASKPVFDFSNQQSMIEAQKKQEMQSQDNNNIDGYSLPSYNDPQPKMPIEKVKELLVKTNAVGDLEKTRDVLRNISSLGYIIPGITDTVEKRNTAGVDLKIQALDQVLGENAKLREAGLPSSVLNKEQLQYVISKYDNGNGPIESAKDIIGELSNRGISLTADAIESAKNITKLNDLGLETIGVTKYLSRPEDKNIENKIKAFLQGGADVVGDVGKTILSLPSYALKAILRVQLPGELGEKVGDALVGDQISKIEESKSGQLERIGLNMLKATNELPLIGDEETKKMLEYDLSQNKTNRLGEETGISTNIEDLQNLQNAGAETAGMIATMPATAEIAAGTKLAPALNLLAKVGQGAFDTIIQKAMSDGELPQDVNEWTMGTLVNTITRALPGYKGQLQGKINAVEGEIKEQGGKLVSNIGKTDPNLYDSQALLNAIENKGLKNTDEIVKYFDSIDVDKGGEELKKILSKELGLDPAFVEGQVKRLQTKGMGVSKKDSSGLIGNLFSITKGISSPILNAIVGKKATKILTEGLPAIVDFIGNKLSSNSEMIMNNKINIDEISNLFKQKQVLADLQKLKGDKVKNYIFDILDNNIAKIMSPIGKMGNKEQNDLEKVNSDIEQVGPEIKQEIIGNLDTNQ